MILYTRLSATSFLHSKYFYSFSNNSMNINIIIFFYLNRIIDLKKSISTILNSFLVIMGCYVSIFKLMSFLLSIEIICIYSVFCFSVHIFLLISFSKFTISLIKTKIFFSEITIIVLY